MQRTQIKGFSLIELLIAIAILAIIVGIGVPSYQYYLQRNRVVGAANSLYYALQLARTEAVKRNATVYVSFVTGTSWCYGINSGSACTCTTPTGCNIGTTDSTTASGLTMTATGLTSNALSFESNHGAAGTTSTITFTVTGDTPSMTVKVSVLGNVQLCSSTINGYQTACS